jgi:hypothetical protein
MLKIVSERRRKFDAEFTMRIHMLHNWPLITCQRHLSINDLKKTHREWVSEWERENLQQVARAYTHIYIYLYDAMIRNIFNERLVKMLKLKDIRSCLWIGKVSIFQITIHQITNNSHLKVNSMSFYFNTLCLIYYFSSFYISQWWVSWTIFLGILPS